MSATGGRRPGRPRPRRPAGLRTPGTDRRVWLARGVPGVRWRQVLRQGAGQRVEQEMAGAEIGAGGPDAPAGDELDGSGRGGPAVDVQCLAQHGRSGPRARRTWIRHVPEPRSCSTGPRNRLSPNRRSPPRPMGCQLSSAATHVSNGTSTIRRNDSHPGAGPMFALMLPPLVFPAQAGPARTAGQRPIRSLAIVISACWLPSGHAGPAILTMPALGVLAVCWQYHGRSRARRDLQQRAAPAAARGDQWQRGSPARRRLTLLGSPASRLRPGTARERPGHRWSSMPWANPAAPSAARGRRTDLVRTG
jgi:hypothetical protein